MAGPAAATSCLFGLENDSDEADVKKNPYIHKLVHVRLWIIVGNLPAGNAHLPCVHPPIVHVRLLPRTYYTMESQFGIDSTIETARGSR
jgi:hypothetical protein